MMNFGLILSVLVTDDDMRAFAEALGATWHAESPGPFAIFERKRQTFVRLDPLPPETVQNEASDSELHELRRRTGGSIGSLISVHYRGNPSSLALAEHVALEALTKWGGTLDRYDRELTGVESEDKPE